MFGLLLKVSNSNFRSFALLERFSTCPADHSAASVQIDVQKRSTKSVWPKVIEPDRTAVLKLFSDQVYHVHRPNLATSSRQPPQSDHKKALRSGGVSAFISEQGILEFTHTRITPAGSPARRQLPEERNFEEAPIQSAFRKRAALPAAWRSRKHRSTRIAKFVRFRANWSIEFRASTEKNAGQRRTKWLKNFW